jgi:hypothetical protein
VLRVTFKPPPHGQRGGCEFKCKVGASNTQAKGNC